MKLPTSKIAHFLSKPDPAIRVILVYGPDAGLVRERATHLAKMTAPDLNDPFRVASLSPASLSEGPSRLFDEMAAQALGGGRRLVRLVNPGEGVAASVAALIADMPPSDSLLLIEAGDLDKRSKLRAACESDTPLACAIPCYIEDTAARTRTITEILKAENINAARDVVAALADILPPDRMAMRSELEKMAIYVGAGNVATIEDVHATVQDAGAAELDDLVFAVGAGETAQAARLIDRLYAEQTSPVAILRAAQRHFIRLQWARAQMDGGLNATDAVKRLQPPVFWKHEGAMASQLRRWPRARAEQALRRLYDAEAAVKSTGTPDTALCAQVLLGLAA
ncbi:MAG: DNA polymerase III subunit delta [Alphaproteobacteria bacterium]|nr:DNA polymerase III subunit delta [Alphaproteobacteria bacterium]